MVEVTFTKITNLDGLLTKNIRPDRKGGIIKTPAASLTNGVAESTKIPFEEYGSYVRGLGSNQAVCHGTCGHKKINLVSQAKFTSQPDTITRSLKYFSYSDRYGIGMFDHDPKPGQKSLEPEEFIKIITCFYPEFGNLPTWWTPSTSCCIYDMEGNEISGEGAGFHLYFPFSPANKLPEFANWLYKKLWVSGHGYIFISKDGKMLDRTIFDKTVFSPERLDFVAGAHCIDCVQKLPDPVYKEREGVAI